MREKFKICFFAILFLAFFSGGAAFASFDDNESSSDSVYSVGDLNFSLDSPEDFSPEITPSQDSTRNISIINNGSLLFKYSAQAIKTGGDDELCGALNLEVKLGGEVKYNESLMDFNLNPPVEISGDRDDWIFAVSLPAGASGDLQNKTCEFDFVFEGLQTGSSFGFSDTEEIENTITSGEWILKILINKVYYDVCDKTNGSCGEYKGKEKDNEWIELYNKSGEAADISGWIICDNSDSQCRTLPDLEIIPAGGYAVITNKESTWDYWHIPSDAVKIALGEKIGNGLANGGDRVILKAPDFTEVDAVSYGNDTYVFNPSCPDVQEGHILGRKPIFENDEIIGYEDTDIADDWEDYILPQVAIIQPIKGEIWYIGGEGPIRWTAENKNGDENPLDLSIDIWYSRDNGSTWANIITDTENDGEYDWAPITLYLYDKNGDPYYVPSSDARIKVVAFGPENFMINSAGISDKFCPPFYGESKKSLKTIVEKNKEEGTENKDKGDNDSEKENQPEGKEEEKKGSFDPAKKEADGGDGDGDDDSDGGDDDKKDGGKSVDGIQTPEL